MPNRWAIASGNWSTGSTWSGSLIPTASDDVYSNNFTVNVDTSFEVLTLRNTASASAVVAGGSFNFNSGSISGSVTSASPLSAGATNLITVTATTGSVGLTLGGAVTGLGTATTQIINHSGNCDFRLNGVSFTGGSTTFALCITKSSLGTITITGSLTGGTGANQGQHAFSSTAGNTVVLGNVNGGNAFNSTVYGILQTAGNLTVTGNVIGGGPNAANQGINFTGTSLVVNGTVIGGATGIAINTTAPITVIGNISGSAFNGISTTAPVIVSGSVIATGAAAAISSTSAIFINVSGSVIASSTANGISSTNASAVVNLAGNIVNVNGKQAIYCQNLFLDNTATTQARFFTFGGSDRTLYSSDTFPNLPSTSNVRFGTTYGPGSGNTGTLRMASPQDVRSGVLTDNTTGSAILSIESLSNEIQTSSDPFAQRLKNLTTVDIIGNLLTAFKK